MVRWPWKDRDEKGRFRKRPAGLLPSGEYGDEFAVEPYEDEEEEEFASPSEQENVVEGEFRELPAGTPIEEAPASVAGPTVSRPKSPESMRDLRARREAARTSAELTEMEKAAKKAQAEIEITRAARAREELSRARRENRLSGVKEVAGYAGKVSRVFAPSLGKKEKSELFFGKAKGSLYVPPTPTTTFLEEVPAKKLHKPQLEKVRRAGAPAAGTTTQIARTVPPPMVRQGQSPLNYGFLRAAGGSGPLNQIVAGQLQGGNKLEQLIYGVIQQNRDSATLEHVKSEMERLGYSRSDVEQALRNLQSQGFVERQGQVVEVRG